VRDVAESHDTLVDLFERIHFFVQRLKTYTGIPLTNELKELLGKVMAQILSILALSTKAMTGRRISELIGSQCTFLANGGSEKILKKLIGKTDVEDALSRLDALTKEETLMMVVRNLEVTHHVDGNVEATKVVAEDIDNNVKATKVVAEDIDNNVKVTKLLVEDIEHNVKGIEGQVEGVARSVDNGTPRFLSVFTHILTLFPIVF
jgi:hypothetical protein